MNGVGDRLVGIGTRPCTPCCQNLTYPQHSASPSVVIGFLIHATPLESCGIWRGVCIDVLESGSRQLLHLLCSRSCGSEVPRLVNLRLGGHGRRLRAQLM